MVKHFAKLSASYLLRPGTPARLGTVWAYFKITLIDHFRIPRRQVKIYGWTVRFPASRAFRQLFEEIFLGEYYRLDTAPPLPFTIVDAGANVGLATLYFKWRFPSASVLCFEPHPESFQFLQANLAANGIKDVNTYNVALGDTERSGRLYGQHLSASLDLDRDLDPTPEAEPDAVSVDVRKLSTFLADRDIALVKLDIEGFEGPVLQDISRFLTDIDHVLMEYHRFPDSPPLSTLLALLERHNHAVEVKFWNSENEIATCIIRSSRTEIAD